MNPKAYPETAGRELDLMIAKRVMGLPHDECRMAEEDVWVSADTQLWFQLPPYSTDIAAAWEVVERMGNTWVLWWHDGYAEWQAKCDPQRATPEQCRHEGWGETAPLAICLAALRAVGSSTDTEEQR